jgi:hypothetical protein
MHERLLARKASEILTRRYSGGIPVPAPSLNKGLSNLERRVSTACSLLQERDDLVGLLADRVPAGSLEDALDLTSGSFEAVEDLACGFTDRQGFERLEAAWDGCWIEPLDADAMVEVVTHELKGCTTTTQAACLATFVANLDSEDARAALCRRVTEESLEFKELRVPQGGILPDPGCPLRSLKHGVACLVGLRMPGYDGWLKPSAGAPEAEPPLRGGSDPMLREAVRTSLMLMCGSGAEARDCVELVTGSFRFAEAASVYRLLLRADRFCAETGTPMTDGCYIESRVVTRVDALGRPTNSETRFFLGKHQLKRYSRRQKRDALERSARRNMKKLTECVEFRELAIREIRQGTRPEAFACLMFWGNPSVLPGDVSDRVQPGETSVRVCGLEFAVPGPARSVADYVIELERLDPALPDALRSRIDRDTLDRMQLLIETGAAKPAVAGALDPSLWESSSSAIHEMLHQNAPVDPKPPAPLLDGLGSSASPATTTSGVSTW